MYRSLLLFLQPIPLVTLLPILLLSYLLLWIVYTRRAHPLAKYPGPFLASVTRFWLIVEVARGSPEKTQRKLHERYGPIVRIAPNEVAIADPEAIKTIYAAHTGFTKTDFYLPFRASWSRYPDAFTNLDERQHTQRRKIVNSLYSMSNILYMEKSVDECVKMLLSKLGECASKGSVVDMSVWIQWHTFDVIGQLFFSRMFGFMENAHDHGGYIHALDLLIPFLTVACVSPTYLRPVIFISGAMIPGVIKALKALKHIEEASKACVAERQIRIDNGKAEDCEDMLQGFFNIVQQKGDQKDYGIIEVQTESHAAFMAGSETTAAAITAILYHLMCTPAAYTTLTAEIDEAAQAGLLSPVIQYHEAVGLPYLMACCKEGMRLHPSIGLTLPRHVPKGGCVIAGKWFPAGTRVGMNAAVVQRNKDVFGEDADEFVPERWLGPDAARMDRYMFQFGGGARTCIGKNISLCEIYKVIPQLIREFCLELSEPDKEWETHNYWLNKPSKVYTTVRRRYSR